MGKRGTRSSGEEAVMGSTIIGSPSKRTRSLRLSQKWLIDMRNEEDRVKSRLQLPATSPATDAEQTQARLWLQAEDSSKYADVEIEFSDGSHLRAHRCILTLASVCFERMFEIGMKEATSCKICEPSISRPAYREFLRYVYTGRCGPSTEMIDGGDLYTLANMHGMVNLRDWAISLIDGRTVAAAAQFAHETEDDFLKDMCCKFVKGHFNSISYAALNGIDERVIAGFVLQAPSQVQAFKLVHGWYTANLAGFSPGDGGGLDEDVSATESLPGLLDMIDLTNIPATDIRDVVIPSGLVPNKVVMELLLSRSIELEQTLSHQSNWVNVTKELESIRTFGRRGSNSGELAHPGGIQVSSEPNCEKIVVADGANHRVQVFDLEGAFQRSYGEEGSGMGQLQRPRDVCLTEGHDIVVADTGNHRIQIFHNDGSISVLGAGPGSEPGLLTKPSGVAVCQDGRLVVADSGNHRIQIFNRDGSVNKVFGSSGSQEGFFKEPRAVAINSRGEILVSDTNNHRIQIFDDQARLKHCFGRLGDGHGEFRMPRKIAIGPYDDIVVADKINNRVQVFMADGTFIQSYGGEDDNAGVVCDGPVGVAVGPQGHIYVTEFGNDRVSVLVARRKQVQDLLPRARSAGGSSP